MENNLKVNSLEEYQLILKRLLANEVKDKPEYFNEEYNHFSCITQSKVSGFLHIRQVLNRINLSIANKDKIDNEKRLLPHKAFQHVVTYFIDYTKFHYIAYPFVENYFKLKDENNTNTEDLIYPERFQYIHDYLKENKSLNENDIGEIIDKYYIKDNAQKLKDKDVLHGIKNPTEFKKLIHLFIYDLLPILLSYKLIFRIFKIMLKNLDLVFPYIFGRIFPKNIKLNTGKLPSMLYGKDQIDPVGFTTKQYRLKNTEVALTQSENAKHLYIWFILSRFAVVYQLTKFGWSEYKLLNYFKMLKEFFREWQPLVNGSEIIASAIDVDIIDIVNEKHLELSTSKNLTQNLTNLAVDFYNNKTYKNHLNNNSFLQYLGCYYHHI
ncbi:MAG: hypothetical protein IPL56_05430 [Saprospiraceae bacterium]|nr:hypothetical protein [Saprospiraceae bacterium]